MGMCSCVRPELGVLFSEIDDAPGSHLLGLRIIIGAVALGGKAAQRR